MALLARLSRRALRLADGGRQSGDVSSLGELARDHGTGAGRRDGAARAADFGAAVAGSAAVPPVPAARARGGAAVPGRAALLVFPERSDERSVLDRVSGRRASGGRR